MGYRFRLFLAECLSAFLIARTTTSTANPATTSRSRRGVVRRRVQQEETGTSSVTTLPWYEKVPSMEWSENRSSFVPYPPAAAAALSEEELQKVPTPLSLDVTVRVSNMNETFAIWTLLKGVIHRLQHQSQNEKDNQPFLRVNPHYFVETGIETNCRTLHLDPDTGVELEAPTVPEPDHCGRDCTNQGRYCLTPLSGNNATTGATTTGADMIQETLRLICLEQLYQASDLRFQEYHEALAVCHARPNSNWDSCGLEALSSVASVSTVDIYDCMHRAGGTQGNVRNVHLQQQIDHRKHEEFYQFVDLPMISVAGKDFRLSPKDWTSKNILSFVCQVFRETTGTAPLGCHLCEPCTDARKCLWTLECDGQPLVGSTMNILLDGNNETNNDYGNNEISISHVDSTTMPPSPPPPLESTMPPLPPLDNTVPPLSPTVIPDDGNTTYTASTGLMPPHNASSIEEEDKEEEQQKISQRDATAMSVVFLILTGVFCVACLRSSSNRREQEVKRRYMESTQARWRSRELDDVPTMMSMDDDDGAPKRKSVRFDTSDRMGTSSTSFSDGSNSGNTSGRKMHGTWHSFLDFWMAGDQQRTNRNILHDNVNKFSSKRFGVDKKNRKRNSVNAGKKYDHDGARVKMENAMRRASLSMEAVFGKSFGNNNSPSSQHASHATINETSLRFSDHSHAAVLAQETAASGQTSRRLPTNMESLRSLVEEFHDEDPPDHLRYSSDWTVGFGGSHGSSSSGFGTRLEVVGMTTGGSDNNNSTRSPVRRTDSNVSAASVGGSDQMPDASVGSVASRTRYSGGLSRDGASFRDLLDEDANTFLGLEDVTML
jgi:hypothetical protein